MIASALRLGAIVLFTTTYACSSAEFAASEPSDAAADAVAEDGAPSDSAGCTPPEAGTCNSMTHCGCLPTQKCDWVGGSLACVKTGSGPLNANCGATTDCARDLTCIGGRCARKCTIVGGTECADIPGTRCGRVPDLESRRADVCAGACDPTVPLALVGCGSDAACRITPSGLLLSEAYCETRYGSAGDREPCSTDANCKPNYFCADAVSGSKLCWKWCRMGKTGQCPTGQTCKANTPKTMVALKGETVELGGCSP